MRTNVGQIGFGVAEEGVQTELSQASLRARAEYGMALL